MKNNNLDSIFDLNTNNSIPDVKKEHHDIVPTTPIDSLTIKDDIRNDYKYSRANIYSIIEKGQEAINGALEMAQETESARAYEVTGQLIKNVADATEKLLELQKKLKDIEEVKDIKGPSTNVNALFVGSTAELSKLFKGKLND